MGKGKKKRNVRKRTLRIIFLIASIVVLSFFGIFLIWKSPPREIKELRQIVRLPMPKFPCPRIALVIDDGGYDMENFKEILALKRPITYAILPHAPYTRETAFLVNNKGGEVILHLPMEPKEKEGLPLEKNMLCKGMPPEKIKMIIQDALREIPYAQGINNHMGSKATEDPQLMNDLMVVLKKKKMFYIDSRTSPNSVGLELAQKNGVPCAHNDRFIDHDKDITLIKQAIRMAIKKAQKDGKGLIIGHPYPETRRALREMIPEIEGLGIKFVFASEVIE